MIAEAAIGHLSEESVVNHAISSGISSVEEIEALRNELRAWRELPGAIVADAHCEAIGRKP